VPRRMAKRKAPSLSGPRTLRSEMLRILRALRDAHAKSREIGERVRIERAMLEVRKRAEKLAAALDRAAALRARQEGYQARIARVGEQIEKLVGRNYRGGDRWLRRWKRL